MSKLAHSFMLTIYRHFIFAVLELCLINTTLNRLIAVFFYVIFAVLIKFDGMVGEL